MTLKYETSRLLRAERVVAALGFASYGHIFLVRLWHTLLLSLLFLSVLLLTWRGYGSAIVHCWCASNASREVPSVAQGRLCLLTTQSTQLLVLLTAPDLFTVPMSPLLQYQYGTVSSHPNCPIQYRLPLSLCLLCTQMNNSNALQVLQITIEYP